MGCGCGKKKVVPTLPASTSNPATLASAAKTYDVLDGEGAVVASTTNLVFARVEARRTGGTVVPRSTTPAPQA